jgi:3-oxoacyl-[acyl-carrier-protein] synthase-3
MYVLDSQLTTCNSQLKTAEHGSSVKAFIGGSGAYVPERVVSNEEIAPTLGLTPERIREASGILRRRWAEPGTRTSDMAARALGAALVDAQVTSQDVDYLILGTMTPDRFVPGSAAAVQKSLGLPSIPALDIRNTCCNFLYAMQLARSLVLSKAARTVALCFAEVQSTWLDMTPASGNMSMLFGDGASAVVVTGGEHKVGLSLELLDTVLHTDGAYTDALGIRAPGTEYGLAHPASCSDFLPNMNGPKVLMRAARSMASACRAVLEKAELTVHDITWVVPHQANLNIMHQLLRLLGVAGHAERLISVIEEYGNTSSASMGMALDFLRRSGRISKGDYVLMPAFGAGFTWGASLCRAV